MSAYQDKINAFRDSLNSSADSFNAAMGNASDYQQSALMDKVGAHADYMAKVGGQIAAGSAMLHTTIRTGKKIKSSFQAYKAKQRAKQTGGNQQEQKSPNQQDEDNETGFNQQKATERPAEGEDEDPRTEGADEVADVADKRETANVIGEEGDKPPEPSGSAEGGAKPAAAADDDEPLASFGNVSEATPEEMERFSKGFTSAQPENVADDEPIASFGNVSEASPEEVSRLLGRPPPAQAADEGGQAPQRAVDRSEPDEPQSAKVAGEPEIQPAPVTAEDRAATAGGDLISADTQEALKPISITAEPDPEPQLTTVEDNLEARITQGAKAFEGKSGLLNPSETSENIAGAVSRTIGADTLEEGTMAAKSAGDTLIKTVASKAAGLVGDAGEMALGAASEAIPVIGEIAGVGMLIHQLVKAHKEKVEAEENPAAAGIAVTPTTREAGGFDPKALMGDTGAVGATLV